MRRTARHGKDDVGEGVGEGIRHSVHQPAIVSVLCHRET